MERYRPLDDTDMKDEIDSPPDFDFEIYRDKISDLNALRCLELYL